MSVRSKAKQKLRQHPEGYLANQLTMQLAIGSSHLKTPHVRSLTTLRLRVGDSLV